MQVVTRARLLSRQIDLGSGPPPARIRSIVGEFSRGATTLEGRFENAALSGTAVDEQLP